MRILLDTNILIRFSDPNDPDRDLAVRALEKLERDGHELRIVPQVIYEYWEVSTRPPANNGLGLTPLEMPQFMKDIVDLFPLL